MQVGRPYECVLRAVPLRDGSIIRIPTMSGWPMRHMASWEWRDYLYSVLAPPHDADDPYRCEIGGES